MVFFSFLDYRTVRVSLVETQLLPGGLSKDNAVNSIFSDYLHSTSWETRVAASEALQAVLKTTPTSSDEIIPSVLLFSSLDLFTTVRDFYPLLRFFSALILQSEFV